MKKCKVAYVHDWLTVNGGAEKVAREILSLYPQADVFSLIDFLSDEDRKDILHGKTAKTTFIQRLPFVKKFYRYYLPLFPYAIEQIDLRGYDLVISSSFSVAKGVLTAANQTHVCYCHSPVRYVWDLHFDYLDDHNKNQGVHGWYLKRVLHKIRLWDFMAAQRVDYFIANSHNVAKRIKKAYRRESEVIYPPVNITDFKIIEEPREDFYVSASRMVPYKKLDIVIKAFNQMPDKKLVIIGDGPDFCRLQKLAKENIVFKGFSCKGELIENLQKAKAFVFGAKEDFGILPVEAMACGTPVIAYNEGGALETVNKKSGLFFNEQTPESIIDAIQRFEKNADTYNAQEIRACSLKFSKEEFRSQFSAFIDKVTQNEI